MTNKQIEVLEQLVSKYKNKQINICIEEMSEFTKALCKYNRGKPDIANIKEEIADVYIMLVQMILLFNIDENEFNKIVDFKINRTKERLLDDNFTCSKCDCSPVCEFAYDPYNIDGDCLLNK